MRRRFPFLPLLLVLATAGAAFLPSPPSLDGKWEQKQSKTVMGRDIPIVALFDLSTEADGSISGTLTVTFKVSDAMPLQEDKVQRFRVKGQYAPPGLTLGVYDTEADTLVSERKGEIVEDGRALSFTDEQGAETSRFVRVE